ncbi:MAG: hypothetical protein HYU69_16465 [Bacteroidetes bacterium]|nr:hypothetical protein [Bacteroidota bacterium]
MSDRKPYKRKGLFIVGTVFLIIGAGAATFSPYTLYLYLAPLWTFLLGLLLIWLSDRQVKTKLIWTLAPFLFYIAFQFLWYQYKKAPAETFLIPQDYRGKIHIHFNKPCGQEEEVANDRRQYKIPATGILLSQFADKQGFIDQQYYLVDSLGKQTLLPQLDVRDYNEEWTTEKNPDEPSRDILGVFHAGRVSSDGMYEFYVSTYRQLRDTFDFQYDKSFDLIEQKIIGDCGQEKK